MGHSEVREIFGLKIFLTQLSFVVWPTGLAYLTPAHAVMNKKSNSFITSFYNNLLQKHIHLLQKVQSNRRKYVDWKIRLDIFDLTTTPTEADILNGI